MISVQPTSMLDQKKVFFGVSRMAYDLYAVHECMYLYSTTIRMTSNNSLAIYMDEMTCVCKDECKKCVYVCDVASKSL